jgi:hypothetical protein
MLEKSHIRGLVAFMSYETALSLLRVNLRLFSNDEEMPLGFSVWADDHFVVHDELRFGALNLSFRCTNETCINYIYGFSTYEELGKHLEEHHSQRSSILPIINQEDHIPQNETPITCPDIEDDSALDADFVYVSFDAGSAQKRKAQKQPARRRTNKRRNGGDVIKPDRQKDPCLRCKILKKEVRLRLLDAWNKAKFDSAMTRLPVNNALNKVLTRKETTGKFLGVSEAVPIALRRYSFLVCCTPSLMDPPYLMGGMHKADQYLTVVRFPISVPRAVH